MRRKDRKVTNPEEIKSVFEKCKVCRIGFKEEDGVYIVPVNYGYCLEEDKHTIYLHGAKEGKKIDLLRKDPEVGVELDYGHELVEGELACQYSYHFVSVIAKGTAELIEDPKEKLKALGIIMKHQTGKEFDEFETNPQLEKTVAVLKVVIRECSCKKHG